MIHDPSVLLLSFVTLLEPLNDILKYSAEALSEGIEYILRYIIIKQQLIPMTTGIKGKWWWWLWICDVIYVAQWQINIHNKFPFKRSKEGNSYLHFFIFPFFAGSLRLPEAHNSIWLSCSTFLRHLQASWKPSHLHTLSFEWCLQMAAACVHFVSSFLTR